MIKQVAKICKEEHRNIVVEKKLTSKNIMSAVPEGDDRSAF